MRWPWGTKAADGGDAAADKRPRGASIVDLIKRLLEDAKTLATSELRLAVAELQAAFGKAAPALILALAGSILLLAALFTLLAAIIAFLAPVVGVGFAALIVAIICAGGGIALLLAARKQIAPIGFVPSRIAKALKSDAEAFKGHQP